MESLSALESLSKQHEIATRKRENTDRFHSLTVRFIEIKKLKKLLCCLGEVLVVGLCNAVTTKSCSYIQTTFQWCPVVVM